MHMDAGTLPHAAWADALLGAWVRSAGPLHEGNAERLRQWLQVSFGTPYPLPRAYGIPRPSVDQRLAGLAEQTLCEE
jgi:hypothetical protein